MVKCKNCRNYDRLVEWCAVIDDNTDITLERSCEHYKCMTNADRIRFMTDEELAKWIYNIAQFENTEDKKPVVGIYDIYSRKYIVIHDSYGDLLKWLQQPAEE